LNSGLEARVEERTRELQQAYKENLKLTEQLQRQVTQLEGRDQLQKHILTIHPLDETLQVVLRTITQYNALDAAIFYLVQGAKVSPKAVAGIGLSEPGQFAQKSELISLDSRIGKISAIGQAMDEKVPVQSGRNVAFLPILKSGDVLGVLEVRCGGSRDLAGELPSLVSFAELAAIAIFDSQMKRADGWTDFVLDELFNDFPVE